MGEFIKNLVLNLIGYAIITCIVTLIYLVFCLLTGSEFKKEVVWTIVGIIFVADLLITSGKKLDDR